MRVISDLPLRLRWQNKSRDIHYIVRHLTETLGTDNLAESHLQVANELFYRNKAAWLVGKLITLPAHCHFCCRSTRRTTASYLLIPV
ncbi:bifunctional isocitrate dehydrogenase kinase/phosphatase [Escherichia coli]|nr:isocitrate dehydrogenase kinase/phosphatase AceK regulatory subunit [Escherichia coli]MDG5898286.1 bifunctional isocitrate dehydrogenase kinase/phosphatase [Escherichia coli]